ncbi:MAG: DUF4178 domain-containing protein [Eubacterium sp.]|nr:DUF4178 domain-containing protein [Eubacterium sp.]
MANRQYYVGEAIKVDGDYYDIIGKITYKNRSDGKTWDEYRLRAVSQPAERWLSVDNYYKEYSLSKANPGASTMGYHLVDSGTEEVIDCTGDVDVQVGDVAEFQEYEDSTEELIVSLEYWDDGVEYSSGYYLDPWEFGKDDEKIPRSFGGKGNNIGSILVTIIFLLVWGLSAAASSISGFFSMNKKISTYLKNSNKYTYSTSITGDGKEKADVYECTSPGTGSEQEVLQAVAHDIIDGINGNTESIQQNDEKGDSTVAILTKKEYCIIYMGEDEKVYVQVSTRKYAYTTDKEPYRSRARTRRYYRRYYYSKGYSSDTSSYGSEHSSYTGYSDGTIDYSSSNELNSYSGNVRQSSIDSRSSDGGGLSSGK